MFNIIRNLGIDLITSSLSVIILNMYFDIFFKRIEHRIRKIIVWGIHFIWQLFISFHKIEPILLNISISIMVAILICICLYEGVWIQKNSFFCNYSVNMGFNGIFNGLYICTFGYRLYDSGVIGIYFI